MVQALYAAREEEARQAAAAEAADRAQKQHEVDFATTNYQNAVNTLNSLQSQIAWQREAENSIKL